MRSGEFRVLSGASLAVVGLLAFLLVLPTPVKAVNVIGLMGPLVHNSEYLFGWSGGNANALSLGLPGGGSAGVSTGVGLFGAGMNQGWWSAVETNGDWNDNYVVGDLSDDGTDLVNAFFTFDLTGVTGSVTSATFNVQRYFGESQLGRTFQHLSVFDVSTDAAVLNYTEGTSQAIFDDLGSGVSYGAFDVTVDGSLDEILNLSLNGNGVADLNKAIGAGNRYFSIGATLAPSGEVPEPTTLGLLGTAFLGFVALRWRKRRNH